MYASAWYTLVVKLGEKGPGGPDMGTVRYRLGGVGICSSTEVAGPMIESLISVLLFYTPPNMISQVGTPAELHP
jgi:hypothetical protein